MPLQDLLHSQLTQSQKEILIQAPIGSVMLAIPADITALHELLQAQPKAITTALATSYTKWPPPNTPPAINLDKILQTNQDHYQNNAPFYTGFTYLTNGEGVEFLSGVPTDDHKLVRALGWTQSPQSVTFTLKDCQAERCNSRALGASYGSFTFDKTETWYLSPGDQVKVRGTFSGMVRRDYPDQTQFEFHWKDCKLISINGKPPQRDPLLENLKSVQ